MNMKFNDYVINVRRQIHRNPELGSTEYQTQNFIMCELKKIGFSVSKTAKTGVVGLLKKGTGKKVIAIRADMDALPIQEVIKKSYSSRNKNIMHACGHDGNMAIVLGACKLLKEEIDFDGTVKSIFQPNEEGSQGADLMIQDGALTNPKPDVIYGVHVNPLLPTNTIGIKDGEFMASVDEIKIIFIGSGGHAAMPHTCQDLVSISARFINYVNEAVSRKIPAQSPCVVSFCVIKGGERFNVIPATLELTGTIRTLNENIRKKIIDIIKAYLISQKIIEKIDFEIEIKNLGNVLMNDADEVNHIIAIIRKNYDEKNLRIITKPSMGGEDFARYLKYIKGSFFYFGTGNKKLHTDYQWHHNKFDIDEKGLLFGAKVLAKIVSERFLI